MSEGGGDPIYLSEDIIGLMRHAAQIAVGAREPFITIRTLLLALLDDGYVGEALHEVVPREKLETYVPEEAGTRLIASRVAEPQMAPGERPAMLRFNTLAFKLPDGSRSVWLSREAFIAWHEGAKRVDEGDAYKPKHLAFGIAADALRHGGLLQELKISPGEVNEVILKL